MASLLCICDQGYRASVEEQDDTVIWLTHMLQKEENFQTALLLRGSAVNYANKAQKSVGVTFGSWVQQNPADFPRDIARYRAEGGRVQAVRADHNARGLSDADLIEGIQVIDKRQIAGLVSEFENVSFW
jgi:hypothetical protein